MALLIGAWIFIYNPPGSDELAKRITENALTSSLLIIQQTTQAEDGSLTSYNPGASGTVIKKEGDRYYVLTAYHVIRPEPDAIRTSLLIFDYNDKTFSDSTQTEKYKGQENYNRKFPKARVEFYDNKSDLAVISFESTERYATIKIAKSLPKFGDLVGTMSNPDDNTRNTVTEGRVLGFRSTKSSMKFYGVKYPMLTHTSHTAAGSSGSMVLNKELQLIGVTLGGTEIKIFAFQFFLAGKAMPCDRILDFLSENGFQI